MTDRKKFRKVTKALVMGICLMAARPLCLAGVDPAAQQLFADAARQVNIFSADTAPFLLEADFHTQIQIPTEGHLSLRWDSRNRFWRRTVNGEFRQIEIKKGETTYVSRNAPFTPVRVREVLNLLSPFRKLNEMQIEKVKTRTDRAVAATCFEVVFEKADGKQSHKICLNQNSREILSNEWTERPDRSRRTEYSDYSEFRGHRYPHKIVLFENGSKVVEVRVLSLETSVLEEALLEVPPGAIERRECDGMKYPVPVATPDPSYPKSSSQNRLMGDTTVAMTVLPDGSVENIQLIGSSTRSMDDATMQTLKGWKFKPALCGSDPVTIDIEVVVSFRLR